MNVVVLPTNPERIVIGIRMAVENKNTLRNQTGGVFDVDDLIADTVNLVRPFFKKTMRKFFAFIKVADFVA